MRNIFFNELHEFAKKNSDITVVIGDVGFSVVDQFSENLPDQFLNVGICEQSMIGIAAGLAMMGKKVFVYSIIPFVTMRCYEQIRNDICYQKLPVTIVGVGEGFAYGTQGSTHHAIEDINIMRGLPGMRIFSPGDLLESKCLVKEVLNSDLPTYIRLGKKNESLVHSTESEIDITRPINLLPSSQNVILSTGYTLKIAYEACIELQKKGIDIGLHSIPCLKPLNINFIKENEYRSIFTIEEHSILGGLGTAISEIIAEELSYKPVFRRFGIPDKFVHFAGTTEYLREHFGLDKKSIVATISALVKN